MIQWVAVAVCSYLLGGIPFSYIAGRLARGLDLRDHGSGNLGASNTFRILGARIAIVVLILDIAKGYWPVFVAGRLEPTVAATHWLMITAMFCSILGHLFSPYLKFSGGKGIATTAGTFFALAPVAAAGALTVFILTFATRRIVSLGSLAGAVTLPVFVYLSQRAGYVDSHWSYLAVSSLIMALVIIKHRSNIARLLAGTEPALSRDRSND